MKRLLYLIPISFFILGLIGCTDDDMESSVPYVSFRLIINLNNSDRHLDESAGNISVYLTHETRGEYEKSVSGNKFVKTYSAPRLAADYGNPGYSGLLVVNTGILNTGIPNADLDKPLCAFDLCCPNENMAETRVIPEGFYAKCPQCGNTYNLQTNGTSETKKGLELRQYRITPKGNNEFQIVN